MGYKTRIKGDVMWEIPKRKKPVAWSTKGASNLIAVIAREEKGLTIRQTRERINYCPEARAILDIYIEKGYGDEIAAHWFK